MATTSPKPLFVLDMPCCCDGNGNTASSASNANTMMSSFMRKVSEEDEHDNDDDDDESSIDEDLGMFDGVTDDDDVSVVDYVKTTSKRSIRVQSAPIVFGDKIQPTVHKKFEPTVIKPFKMTIRCVTLKRGFFSFFFILLFKESLYLSNGKLA